MEIMLYSYVNLHSLIKRINIYLNMYSFNQTIVSFKVYTRVYTEISQKVRSWKFGLNTWKSPGDPLVMWMNLFIGHVDEPVHWS